MLRQALVRVLEATNTAVKSTIQRLSAGILHEGSVQRGRTAVDYGEG